MVNGIAIADEVGQNSGKFPFVMVMTSVFVRGSSFIFLVAPLLYMRMKGDTKATYSALLAEIGSTIASALKSVGTAPALTLLLLFCMLTGFLVSPFERLFRFLVLQLIRFLLYPLYLVCRRVVRRVPKNGEVDHPLRAELSPPLLAADFYGKPEYVPLMSWLFKMPAAKAHWEWQLFHNYIYWGLSASVALHVGLAISLVNGISAAALSLLLVVCLLLVGSALYHSAHMARVHEFYIVQSGVRATD
ncbi:MAG: hypothetical protein ABIK65_05815 [Candidatus Eisenbacteria bacterium]